MLLHANFLTAKPTYGKASIVCTPPLSAAGEVEPPTKFSKRGGLTGPQSLERGWWGKGGDFIRRVWNFHTKDKLKSEIFNDKKSL